MSINRQNTQNIKWQVTPLLAADPSIGTDTV